MAIERIVVDGHSPNTWQTVVIDQVVRETPTVKTFRLRPDHWHPFDPGQHLEVRLTAGDGYQAQRSYSIGSSPDLTGFYELTVERLEDGEVSSWFHDVAELGDVFEVRGPFGGHLVWKPTDAGPILLVAGGSGIVPIMSIIRQRARLAPGTPATLLYATRTWDDVIYRDDLVAREQAETRISLVFALSRGQPVRPQDFARRIDREIVNAAISPLNGLPAVSYVCGSNAFAEAAAQLLLQTGADPQSIRVERFGE